MQRPKVMLLLSIAFMVFIFMTACSRPQPGGCDVEGLTEDFMTEEGTEMLPKDLSKEKPPIDTMIPARLETATFALG